MLFQPILALDIMNFLSWQNYWGGKTICLPPPPIFSLGGDCPPTPQDRRLWVHVYNVWSSHVVLTNPHVNLKMEFIILRIYENSENLSKFTPVYGIILLCDLVLYFLCGNKWTKLMNMCVCVCTVLRTICWTSEGKHTNNWWTFF